MGGWVISEFRDSISICFGVYAGGGVIILIQYVIVESHIFLLRNFILGLDTQNLLQVKFTPVWVITLLVLFDLYYIFPRRILPCH